MDTDQRRSMQERQCTVESSSVTHTQVRTFDAVKYVYLLAVHCTLPCIDCCNYGDFSLLYLFVLFSKHTVIIVNLVWNGTYIHTA